MKKLLKFYLLTFVLLSDFVAFAQIVEPPDEGDPIPAPINGKMILLAIAGVCFVIYTFSKNKKTA